MDWGTHFRWVSTVLALVALAGCVTIKQVNRGILAKPMMSFNPEPKKTMFLNDIHAIREGAQGGGDQGAGGGCGCN